MYEVTPGRWYSDVSIREVLRYSGVRSFKDCDEKIISDAVRAAEQAGEASLPKSVSRECSLSVSGNVCVIDGLEIVSRSLAEHLAGCERALLFAATLGSGVDMLIGRYSAVRMSYAVLLQGAAAALIELYCDIECAALESRYLAEGCFLLPRFSPGYGDFPLECQQTLTGHLNAYKYAGIAVSDGGQMTPMKSVSAVIGLSREGKSRRGSCASGKCADCPNTGCLFRRV
ncbi:MAG: Vitamin B12 dependent methionine synthase activation subunit [Clostridia bacterium]|nr:Vitamin B12 dependent methionine synthase activation subunit [Clostridia bacterium]